MVFGSSLFGPIATTLLAASVRQQPASTIVNRVRSMYDELEPCRLTGIGYNNNSIQFSHVFSSTDQRDTFASTKQVIFHQVASTHNYTKPVLIYLPGLDAAGISAQSQLDSLSKAFELWRMTVDTSDRSSFLDLTNSVSLFIQDLVSSSSENRTIILVGESFGGLLAPSVALRVQDKLAGLVLINPATSFDQTPWTSLLPVLASISAEEEQSSIDTSRSLRLPTPYSVLGGFLLGLTIPDRNQFGKIIDLIRNVPLRNSQDISDTYMSLVDGFGILQNRIPAATLIYRIKSWLVVGTQVINSKRLSELRINTLVIAGNEDKMLPTKEEATRLQTLIPNCTKVEFQSSGHFTLDDRVNLTDIILDERYNIFPGKYDPIVDWKPPSRAYTQQRIEEKVQPLRSLFGPVFFSTDSKGRRHRGLGFVPSHTGGPILFVANHQFGGQDINLIVPQLIEDRNLYVRGLAHPILFQAAVNNSTKNDPDYINYGIVEVSPRNYYRLMETKQAALLFPGGVREVFHGKDEAYQLFWPEKVDFVRIAAKFNATIVPLSAIGAADSVQILIDPPDMLKLPFGLGEQLANNSRNVMAARYDANADSELFIPPFALPGLPARHYFVFGRPIQTHNLDPKDKAACSKVYAEIQDEMNRGFKDLLRAREKDPFLDTGRRLTYELATGKPAPTFSVDLLNLNQ